MDEDEIAYVALFRGYILFSSIKMFPLLCMFMAFKSVLMNCSVCAQNLGNENSGN